MPTLRFGDQVIAYSVHGSGEPVVLIHGGETGKIQYDSMRTLLGPGVRAIGYDQRDTGDSLNPADSYGIQDLADDCQALIEGLGYQRAHIFGASFGGAIALQLALTRPQVVHSLALGATLARIDFQANATTGAIVETPPDQRTAQMLDFVLSPQGQASEEMVAELMALLIHRTPEADVRRLDAVRHFDVTDRLAEIAAPTLLIYGQDDQGATPAAGEQIAAAIPNSRLELLPGVRHGITVEGKHQTAKLLREFVLAHPINGS
ncbi:alpha/beta fold hydrolase [Mycobacterium sp. 141]|uniref:alpha/beta fold hydrolase n=1 Tax=Mycobacterium sp. 141 TaxID=1120797 RepID=UPI00036BADCC|nr:alpha/beta hydrolase [Mycobacterium sp. 141]